MQQPLLMSRKEAASALGVSVKMLDHLIFRGRIPACRIGRRVFVGRSVLEGFILADAMVEMERNLAEAPPSA